jgi:hypothetical protein
VTAPLRAPVPIGAGDGGRAPRDPHFTQLTGSHSRRVGLERPETRGQIVVAGGICEQRVGAGRDVLVAVGVENRAFVPLAMLSSPVVLEASGLLPVAVLSWPVLL